MVQRRLELQLTIGSSGSSRGSSSGGAAAAAAAVRVVALLCRERLSRRSGRSPRRWLVADAAGGKGSVLPANYCLPTRRLRCHRLA